MNLVELGSCAICNVFVLLMVSGTVCNIYALLMVSGTRLAGKRLTVTFLFYQIYFLNFPGSSTLVDTISPHLRQNV